MSGRLAAWPHRLLPRIYLMGLLQFSLITSTLALARQYLLQTPERKETQLQASHLALELAPLPGAEAEFNQAAARARRRLGARMTVRDARGALLASSADEPHAPLPPESVALLEQRRVLMVDAPDTVGVALPEDGPLRSYAMVTLPRRGADPERLVILGCIVLSCTALMSLLMARMLAAPLERLVTTARHFGAGELEVRTGLRRRDELGQVAEAFDEMAERITRLLRSQKELIANVSHELRTPLSRIRVALDLAADGDADAARESLADIAGDLVELERLVGDVLTTARLEFSQGGATGATPPLRLERVEARELLDRASERFRSARPEHRLEVLVDGTLPALEADPVLLRRVLDNLLDNAGKYSEPGTTVGLQARAHAGRLEVEISDEGIGIGEQDVQHLFTPFFRSDRSRTRDTGGMGLGLTLARRIAEAHGGSLVLERRAEVGMIARLSLPVAGPRNLERTGREPGVATRES